MRGSRRAASFPAREARPMDDWLCRFVAALGLEIRETLLPTLRVPNSVTAWILTVLFLAALARSHTSSVA
jgi:hypothetical protein